MNSRLYSSQALHAGILHELGRAIASGELAEGAALPRESELQDRFDASRQTVREAIKILAAKGMVRARKRAGTFVQPRYMMPLAFPLCVSAGRLGPWLWPVVALCVLASCALAAVGALPPLAVA